MGSIKEKFRNAKFMHWFFKNRENRRMELAEALTLGPIEKWIRFGRFPTKLVLALAITTLVTVQTIVIYNPENVYVGQTTSAMRTFLFRDDVELDERLLSESVASTPEALCALEWFVNAHANIGELFTGIVYYSEAYIETPYPGPPPPLNVTFEWAPAPHGAEDLDFPASAQWTADARMSPFDLVPSDDSIECGDPEAVAQATPFIQSLTGLTASFRFFTEYRPTPRRRSVVLEFTGQLKFRRNSLGQSPVFSSNIDISSVYVRLPPSRILSVYSTRFALSVITIVLCIFSNILTAIAAYRSVGYYRYARCIHRIALHNKGVRRRRERDRAADRRAAAEVARVRREIAAAQLEALAAQAAAQAAGPAADHSTLGVLDAASDTALSPTSDAAAAAVAAAAAAAGGSQPGAHPAVALAPTGEPTGYGAAQFMAAAAAMLNEPERRGVGVGGVSDDRDSEMDSSTSSDESLMQFYDGGDGDDSSDSLSEGDEEYAIDVLSDLPLVNGWHVISFVGVTLTLSYNVLDMLIIFLGTDVEVSRQLLIGLAAAFNWLNICRFFEYDKRLYIFFVQLKKGWGVLVRYFISVMPLFMSFTLMGLAMFARFEPTLFPDLGQSVATLFSVIHGDSVLDVFGKLYYDWPFWSRFYVIVFITLFICIILSTFIVICEDSFALARKELCGKDVRLLGFNSLRGKLRGKDVHPTAEEPAQLAGVPAPGSPQRPQRRVQRHQYGYDEISSSSSSSI